MSLKFVTYNLGEDLLRNIAARTGFVGSIDSISDSGVYTKAVSSQYALNQLSTSGVWTIFNKGVGYKTIYNATILTDALTDSEIVYKHNGVFTHNRSIPQNANESRINSTPRLFLTPADNETGWDSAWDESTVFIGMTWHDLISAFVNGWKLTTVDTNVANCEWHGNESTTTKSGATGYDFVKSNVDVGFMVSYMYYGYVVPLTSNKPLYTNFSKSFGMCSYGKDNLAL